jgi:hypothetical protein
MRARISASVRVACHGGTEARRGGRGELASLRESPRGVSGEAAERRQERSLKRQGRYVLGRMENYAPQRLADVEEMLIFENYEV